MSSPLTHGPPTAPAGPANTARTRPSLRRAARPWTVLRRVPRAAWLCALVACVNAVCWSFITPPFQIPDEPDHYSFVEQLALTGQLPTSSAELSYPTDEALAISSVHAIRVRLQPENRPALSAAEQEALERENAVVQRTPVAATGAAGVATAEPPLYYVLELIPYELGAGGSVLERVELMRLTSALLAGLTAMFVFLFAREALPRARWAWAVSGMAVALTPMLAFMSGGVTPEAGLYAASAAVFFCLARAFRLGLTNRRAAAIGAVTVIGLLTKVNFSGLVPGIALGTIVLAVRLGRRSRGDALRALGVAALTVGALVAAALLTGAIGFSGPRASALDEVTSHGSLLGRIEYTWQLFLPRLPGMPNDFPGGFPLRQIWFNGLVGLFGWLDTTFPRWVYELALLPAGALALLLARGLFANRAALRRRAGEAVTYATMAVGLLLLIGSASYKGFPFIGLGYAQSRYLLPLLALMGGALAVAARGAGRRWGPAVGASILVLFLAHDVFSQLQVIARYYG